MPAINMKLTVAANMSPFWNLGTTPQEWRQTPLTKDWLFQTSDVGSGSLVLEADLSCDSLSEYLSQQDIPTIQSMENTRWVSKILGMIAQQNGVVYPSGENVDDENASSVTVLIGNGKRPLELSEIDNVIYIDGLASVAAKVYSVLETMNSKPCPDDKLEAEPTPDDGDQKGYSHFRFGLCWNEASTRWNSCSDCNRRSLFSKKRGKECLRSIGSLICATLGATSHALRMDSDRL